MIEKINKVNEVLEQVVSKLKNNYERLEEKAIEAEKTIDEQSTVAEYEALALLKKDAIMSKILYQYYSQKLKKVMDRAENSVVEMAAINGKSDSFELEIRSKDFTNINLDELCKGVRSNAITEEIISSFELFSGSDASPKEPKRKVEYESNEKGNYDIKATDDELILSGIGGGCCSHDEKGRHSGYSIYTAGGGAVGPEELKNAGGDAKPLEEKYRYAGGDAQPLTEELKHAGGNAIPLEDLKMIGGDAEPISDEARHAGGDAEPISERLRRAGGGAAPRSERSSRKDEKEITPERLMRIGGSSPSFSSLEKVGGDAIPLDDLMKIGGDEEPLTDELRHAHGFMQPITEDLKFAGGDGIPEYEKMMGVGGSAEPKNESSLKTANKKGRKTKFNDIKK